MAFVLVMLLASQTVPGQAKSYRLPGVDLKQPIIWDATCDEPAGQGLAFGGQDQFAEDGNPHTRMKIDGQWRAIHEELRADHRLQPFHRAVLDVVGELKSELALLRGAYLDGKLGDEREVEPTRVRWKRTFSTLAAALETQRSRRQAELPEYEKSQLARAGARLKELANETLAPHEPAPAAKAAAWPALLAELLRWQSGLEQAAEWLDAEPPARALSPLVYDAKTKRYVLFGGDHLDYLTNDTWVFDPNPNPNPNLRQRKWYQRHPTQAPPPRANHSLRATGDGTVVLTGGYRYTSSTDYTGGQYREHDDGDWTYDVVAGTWTSGSGRAGVSPESRVYRTGPFHPDFFLQGPPPDRQAVSATLETAAENTWVAMNPPQLPQLNRDWGSAVLDPDRNLILRWSGGHSAHGGTDVLHYHLATNRWELPCPVEFPLGQLYSNTSYPEGFNLNRRPWVTGHTYQNYGYDPLTKTMLFTGRHEHCYVYDPDLADWTGRFRKPNGMTYNSCFYTLTLCPTKHGLVTWTEHGRLFLFDDDHREWTELRLSGDMKLPGAIVDNSTVVYDSRRDRLLFFVKSYGDKHVYDGTIHAVDWPTRTISRLTPSGSSAAHRISYLCQIRYDEAHDLLLVGATLPPDDTGLRRTPVYDCRTNAWQSLRLTGTDPNGKNGRNVSLGLMYDSQRKLFWAVDTRSQVYALRLRPDAADRRALD